MRGFEKESGSIPGQVVPDGGVRVGDLTALLARVEAADGPDRELDFQIHAAVFGRAINFQDAAGYLFGEGRDEKFATCGQLTASLDAALALCGRVLPGWTRMVDENFGIGEATVWTGYVFTPKDALCAQYEGYSKTPSLALLAAMLKALMAQAASPSGATVTSPGMDP